VGVLLCDVGCVLVGSDGAEIVGNALVVDELRVKVAVCLIVEWRRPRLWGESLGRVDIADIAPAIAVGVALCGVVVFGAVILGGRDVVPVRARILAGFAGPGAVARGHDLGHPGGCLGGRQVDVLLEVERRHPRWIAPTAVDDAHEVAVARQERTARVARPGMLQESFAGERRRARDRPAVVKRVRANTEPADPCAEGLLRRVAVIGVYPEADELQGVLGAAVRWVVALDRRQPRLLWNRDVG
jgi:hypothetical protein